MTIFSDSGTVLVRKLLEISQSYFTVLDHWHRFGMAEACKQLKNYERMKLLMERWIDLATELSTMRLTQKAG